MLDAPTGRAKPPATSATTEPAGPPTTRSIVIVEDELLVLWFALDLLKGLGHVPIEARTAAEALALLDDGARDVDAMVIDLGLSDMSGDALVLRARTDTPIFRSSSPAAMAKNTWMRWPASGGSLT